jgi:hypothetical protein
MTTDTSGDPSALTLPGLAQHLAEAERTWFQRVFGGLDVLPVFEEATGYALAPERGLHDALTAWRGKVARGRELIAGRSLEEHARHNGHADVLRERIDGTTGV